MARGKQKDKQIRDLLERNSGIIDKIYENDALKERIAQLERQLESRDTFISNRDLWLDFVDQLPQAKEKQDG